MVHSVSFQQMNKQVLYQDLERFLTVLRMLHPYSVNSRNVERRTEVRAFMDGFLNLYLALKADSSIVAEPQFQNYLRESADLLTWITFDIGIFISEINQALREPFYGDEWFGICRNRSAIEAFRELYQNTNLGKHLSVNPDLPNLDTTALDEEIRWKGEKECVLSQEQIPAGIPSSHWWWLSSLPSDSREVQP